MSVGEAQLLWGLGIAGSLRELFAFLFVLHELVPILTQMMRDTI